MLRTISTCEKNLVPLPAAAIVIPDSVSTIVIVDYRTVVSFAHEIASITLQNVGGNQVFIAFGQDADGTKAYHKVIQSGQELAVPLVCQVSAFAVGGTTIAPCILRREGY